MILLVNNEGEIFILEGCKMDKFLTIVSFLFLFSCESKNNEVAISNSHLVKINPPTMYAVELVALNFFEDDFNLNTLGNPYPLFFDYMKTENLYGEKS